MYWNHRVVKTKTEYGVGENKEVEILYQIQEVYYNQANEPCAYCDPCVLGDSMKELQEQVLRFTECLDAPVLDAETDFNHKLYEDEDEDAQHD
jgi:hypothetical protein